MCNLIIVSLTHGGLTALMRSLRGSSNAAARTKPSSPALTMEMDALSGVGLAVPLRRLQALWRCERAKPGPSAYSLGQRACRHHSPIAACSEVQRRHALRRRIPVTLRRPSVVTPNHFLPMDGGGQALLKWRHLAVVLGRERAPGTTSRSRRRAQRQESLPVVLRRSDPPPPKWSDLRYVSDIATQGPAWS